MLLLSNSVTEISGSAYTSVYFRIVLSELHDVYFMETVHAQRVLAEWRGKRRLPATEFDVQEVHYLDHTDPVNYHAYCVCQV